MNNALTLGILLPKVVSFRGRGDFFTRVVAGIRTAAKGHHVLTLVGADPVMASHHMDGCIVVVDPSYLRVPCLLGKPVIGLAFQDPQQAIPTVSSDNWSAMAQLVEHLIQHGNTRIGFVGSIRYNELNQRYRSYRETMEKHGLLVDEAHVIQPDDNDIPSTVSALTGKLRQMHCTAIVCATDEHAMGVIQAAQHCGLRVPEDLAVVGFDDLEHSTYLRPPMTTIQQNFEAMGRSAVEILLAQIIEGKQPQLVTYTPTQMKIRRSCGCRLSADILPAAVEPRDLSVRWQEQVEHRLDEIAHDAYPAEISPMKNASAVIVHGLDAAINRSTMPYVSDLELACDELTSGLLTFEQINQYLAVLDDTGSRLLHGVPGYL